VVPIRNEVSEKNNIIIVYMKPIIGVYNPYGLVQKAGKKRTYKRKITRRKKNLRKTRRTLKK
jgi:hypothetical protein